MTKIFVLDTNVLLDDPNALFSFADNDIVLPYQVIEELEKHKTSQGALGMNARDCGRKIADLFSAAKNVNLKEGINLPGEHGLLRVLSPDDVPAHGLNLKGPDDHILAVALGMSKDTYFKGRDISLITNDVLLQLRASSNGLQVDGYSGTVQINSLDELYTGHSNVEVSNTTMSKFWASHGKDADFFDVATSKVSEAPLPNDFCILNDNPKALIRHMEDGRMKIVREENAGKIKPMNVEQTIALDLLMDPEVDMVTLTGISGCGKTLLALAAGLEQVINRKTYKNVLVIRPVHSVGKEIGFLPGTKEEKMEPWIAPIKDNIRFCLATGNGRKSKQSNDTMQYVFDRGYVEIEAMTFIRGRSINNAYIMIDEAQNLNAHELKAILTRVGEGTKIVLTGDIEQTDRTDVDSISNGLSVAIEKFKEYGLAGHVGLKEGIRSKLSELAAKLL